MSKSNLVIVTRKNSAGEMIGEPVVVNVAPKQTRKQVAFEFLNNTAKLASIGFLGMLLAILLIGCVANSL